MGRVVSGMTSERLADIRWRRDDDPGRHGGGVIPKESDVVTLASGSEWIVERYFPESTIVALVSPDSADKIHVLAETLQPASTLRAAPEDVNTPQPD